MHKSIMFFFILFFMNPILSFSQGTKGIYKNFENISGQYAECAAYYRLVYHAMASSNDLETARLYRELEDTAMLYSLILANEGRNKDNSVEVTNSRIEMHMKKMKHEADNRNENISILINKYHFGCQGAMENPLNELLDLLKNELGSPEGQIRF